MINIQDNEVTRQLNHGRVVVTLTSKVTGDHITLHLRAKNRNIKKRYLRFEQAAILACNAGRGDDMVGFIMLVGQNVGQFRRNRGADEKRVKAFECLWQYITTGHLNSNLALKVESFCARCSRPLRDPESIDRGIGPECLGKSTSSHHASRAPRPEENVQMSLGAS